MPSPTYTLISSNVLASSAASVTFSSIPSTYTDLVLRMSVRTDISGTDGFMYVHLNGDTTTTNYSDTWIQGDGASATSSRITTSTGYPGALIEGVTGSTATANTFSNIETYIPSYLVAQKKQFSSFGVGENNATTAYMRATAHLYQPTTAVSSILLAPQGGTNFVSGCSFYLYGVKNS